MLTKDDCRWLKGEMHTLVQFYRNRARTFTGTIAEQNAEQAKNAEKMLWKLEEELGELKPGSVNPDALDKPVPKDIVLQEEKKS